MIAFSGLVFLLIAVVAIYPTIVLKKRQRTALWDYVYPLTGVAAWFVLSGVGSTASISNFVVEVFCIFILSALLPWVRLLLSRVEKDQIETLSFLLTFLPIVASVTVRLTMPTLPE